MAFSYSNVSIKTLHQAFSKRASIRILSLIILNLILFSAEKMALFSNESNDNNNYDYDNKNDNSNHYNSIDNMNKNSIRSNEEIKK